MKNIVTIIVALVLCTSSLWAQDNSSVDPIETKIYFRLGESDIDLSYKENKDALEFFVSELNSLGSNQDYVIRSITVTGSASPEGNSVFNEQLSNKRTESLYRWVVGMFPQYKHLVKKNSIGVDWEQLITIVENSYVPYKSDVLDILKNTPIWIRRGGKIVDGRVKQLKDLDDGHVWRYMYRNFFAEMRMAGGGIVCEVECKKPSISYQEQIVISSKRSLVVVNGDTTSYSNNDVFSVVPKDTIHLNYKDTIRITNDSEKFQQVIEEAIEETPRKVKKGKTKTVKTNVAKNGHRGFSMGIKTNTLYDLALIPNIGADFHLGKGWTIGFNWMYAWWNIEDYRLYHRVYGGDINVRKYFSSKHDSPLSGHHVGLYSEILTYDIAYGGKGQKADRWSYGAGVEYGYSFPIARRLNLDLTIGAGYLTGKYENYSATEEANHYVWESSYMRRWLGPTKAEVSLVWLIGRNNYTQK